MKIDKGWVVIIAMIIVMILLTCYYVNSHHNLVENGKIHRDWVYDVIEYFHPYKVPLTGNTQGFCPDEMIKGYDDKGTYYAATPIVTPTPRYTIHGVKLNPGDNELHCGCINKCICGDEEADEEIINNAIKEGEFQYSRNGNGITPPDLNKELKESHKRCVVIYVNQTDIAGAYADKIKKWDALITIPSVELVKVMREQIMKELDNWKRIRDEAKRWDMMYSDISDNLTEYRDDITSIAMRQHIVERLYGLKWDFDTNKYEENKK